VSRTAVSVAQLWTLVGTRFLPFADVVSAELPWSRLLRLSLFQVSVGISASLLMGTLNRVMIVELGVSAWLVALMFALPIVLAPWRTLIGFRSDHHVSALGWKRVPYIWFGALLQFGGLAIMPFSLLILSGDTHGPAWIGPASAALAFLLAGAGMQTTQTAGLALATDLAPVASRPAVVALMHCSLLVGMVASGIAFGLLLSNFSQIRLIQVVQGAALLTMILNLIALWKQEPRRSNDVPLELLKAKRPKFGDVWFEFLKQPKRMRYLLALALGSAAFSMQDIVLEPYGAIALKMSVASTTQLSAILACGAIFAFALSARSLRNGFDAYRLAALGVLIGIPAFALVIFSAPLQSVWLFRLAVLLVGFGGGMFAVATLTVAMNLDEGQQAGLTLGAWGAVQASAAGIAIGLGGVIRDLISTQAVQGLWGSALADANTGFSVVFHLEILLLFLTLIVIGPLVRPVGSAHFSQRRAGAMTQPNRAGQSRDMPAQLDY
jgi:MFS transporter, BCD family, chlorophyll transporter